LKILRSALAASAVRKNQYPAEELKEIVLLGRSNAGKSSLINALLQRKSLARTSSAPGKTRLLNFYLAEASSDGKFFKWYFVDLPGYGYARAGKGERAAWLDMMDAFLCCDTQNKYCWQFMDIRHRPSKEDLLMFNILKEAGFALKIIAAKADKISRASRSKHLRLISGELNISPGEITVFSAVNGEGREELLRLVCGFCLGGAGAST
jgi:GTP-binding protein